jgi:hypothetical protein
MDVDGRGEVLIAERHGSATRHDWIRPSQTTRPSAVFIRATCG